MAVVDASFQFLQWQALYSKQKPYEVFLPAESFQNKIPRSNLVFEPHSVRVHDVRTQRDEYTLDTHGFQFIRHITMVEDFKDRTVVQQSYIPEMERLLGQHLSQSQGGHGDAVRTVCFDFRLRESIDTDEFAKRNINLEDGFDRLLPATHPHIDQSTRGAVLRVKRHMGEEAEKLLKGRVRVINVWRPLADVRSWPLALCDARTVSPDDLVTCDIVRRRYVGETYFGKFNPAQKWHYLSGMTPEDVIFIKVYDSDQTVQVQRKRFYCNSTQDMCLTLLLCRIGCLHASFQLTDSPHPRVSIELRILVFGG
ncbi:hypothetical protein QBC36DRAFT_196266 [Triangularia setosa]|uniref:Uncharacterized protein n=1 Tax=Triangularia setosa TaxID=2587417 RepID=A0AAN6VZQ5_9PEZI|nr:hypothetical protein QBC36DRAFT_196266 [Podospora setosa]